MGIVMSSFRFRKKTDYGLVMIALLSRRGKGEIMSVVEMEEVGLPRSFLVKIAKDLIGVGILGAKEGRGGGYYLRKEPRRVTVGEVVKALEGEMLTADCLKREKNCPMKENCPHKKGMQRLGEELARVLDSYTVEKLGRE